MNPSLFRRLIEGIPLRPDTWSERFMQDHALDDFVAFTGEEIAAIAAFLHEERETARPVVPDETDTQKEEDIDWEGEENIGRPRPRHQILSVYSNKPVCMRAGIAVTGHS
jgi:hypothetical protein